MNHWRSCILALESITIFYYAFSTQHLSVLHFHAIGRSFFIYSLLMSPNNAFWCRWCRWSSADIRSSPLMLFILCCTAIDMSSSLTTWICVSSTAKLSDNTCSAAHKFHQRQIKWLYRNKTIEVASGWGWKKDTNLSNTLRVSYQIFSFVDFLKKFSFWVCFSASWVWMKLFLSLSPP